MSGFFNFSSDRLARPLLALMALSAALLILLALRAPHLARIGLRNARRRKARTSLIIAGLMLSTMFIASALAVDDTITLAVKTIAVFNLGRVDEDVTGGSGALALYPQEVGASVRDALDSSPHVAGVAPALVVPNLLVADETARQVRGGVSGLGLAPQNGGPLTDLRDATRAPAPVGALTAGQVYLNTSVATLLNAHAGDTIALYSTLWPGHRYRYTVRAIVSGGPLGDSPSLVLPLATLQGVAGANGQINHIYVANAGNGLTGVGYSEEIEDRIYRTLFHSSEQVSVSGGQSNGLGVRVVGPGGQAPGQNIFILTQSSAQALNLRVHKVKQDGINFALQAQDIFGRILALFTLFALSIGLLLIFLIFVLLAAERRAEFGVLRALGTRRSRIVRLLLFEGAYYDGFAAALGMLAGLGLGILLVALVSPVIAKIGFPLQISVTPQSVITAFSLGLLVTLATIWIAAWAVSRMTVAAAMRDLPEPPAPQPSLLALLGDALALPLGQPKTPRERRRAMLSAWRALLWALVTRGVVPLVVGWWLVRRGRQSGDALFFSLGLSALAVGAALALRACYLGLLALILRLIRAPNRTLRLVRANRMIGRLTALMIGAALALYWSLPFDATRRWGFARFGGNGIETFFIAGVMMVFGTVWALAPNLDLLLAPVSWLLARLGRLRHITRVALIYPAHHRYRTGIGLSLFSLVCFTMVVMACIAASTTRSYDNIPAQASGYDVAGQPLFAPVGGVGPVADTLQKNSIAAESAVAALSAATPLPFGILQPDTGNARWQVYPTSEISGAFLNGVGLPLAARASGYSSDAAVWQAVRDHPGDVVIDAGALSPEDAAALGLTQPPEIGPQQFIGPPIASGLPGLSSLESLNGSTPGSAQSQSANGLGPLAAFVAAAQDPYILDQVTLRLNDVATGAGQFAPIPLWAGDLRGGAAAKLTVVGIVDNSHGQRYGLFGSPQTFAPIEKGLAPFGNEYYYFKLKPGADARATSLQIGSALLNYGFETTVLQDILLDVNGPRVFISRVLVGLVGLTLLVGMAALAVTGSRAVVERRQQIGMLRALGFHRLHVQAIFLIESLLVGALGTAIGLALGLVLCRNVFAVNFFASFQSGLTLYVPWPELFAICGASLLASTIAALLPAWQAGRIAPADALRYE